VEPSKVEDRRAAVDRSMQKSNMKVVMLGATEDHRAKMHVWVERLLPIEHSVGHDRPLVQARQKAF
jgi:hypothetical protein